MAIKKTYRLSLEVEYYKVNEDGKENEDEWIESTYFKTSKEAGKDLHVTCLKPNVGIEPFFDQLHEMQAILDESVDLLKEFEKPERVLGEKKLEKGTLYFNKSDKNR